MLEFEGLVAVGAFEFAESSTLVVTDHVTLEAVHVGKVLLAHATRLMRGGRRRNNIRKRNAVRQAQSFHFPSPSLPL